MISSRTTHWGDFSESLGLLAWSPKPARSRFGRRSDQRAEIGEGRESSGISYPMFFAGVAVMLIISVGAFFYMHEVVTTAASGYDVSTLERRAEELRAKEASLELETAKLESLQHISDRLSALNLVPVGAVQYTSPRSESVVTSRVPVGVATP